MGKFFFKKKLATAQIDLTESCVSLGLCSVQQTLPVCEVLLYIALPVENFGALLSLGVLCSGEMANVPILSVFLVFNLFGPFGLVLPDGL